MLRDILEGRGIKDVARFEKRIADLLWDHMLVCPEFPEDRRCTSFGTKTKIGLAATIWRIVEEEVKHL